MHRRAPSLPNVKPFTARSPIESAFDRFVASRDPSSFDDMMDEALYPPTAEAREVVERFDRSATTTEPGEYERRGTELGRLVDTKQAQYGNSVARSADMLASLYPNGIKPERYADVLLVVRILDKLSRIATRGPGDGESPFLDVAGYGILGARKDESK